MCKQIAKLSDSAHGKVYNQYELIARDLLVESMLNFEKDGCKAVTHIHDEIVYRKVNINEG